MAADDAFDAALTETGLEQARQLHEEVKETVKNVDLIVASPLSRALNTANVVTPQALHPSIPRVAVEDWREISGLLLNAKRRTKTDLQELFPDWSFQELPSDHDDNWPPDCLEDTRVVANRAYAGLQWIWEREERNIAVFAHGGVYNFLMNAPGHANLRCDEAMRTRFHNCEMKSSRLCVVEEGPENIKVFALEMI